MLNVLWKTGTILIECEGHAYHYKHLLYRTTFQHKTIVSYKLIERRETQDCFHLDFRMSIKR